MVEEVYDLFRCLLDDANQICFLVFAVYYYFGDLGSELFVFLACLRKIGYVVPEFAAVLEVDEELRDVGVRALE